MKDLKAVVRRALFEGANPRGFSSALKAVCQEIMAEAEAEKERNEKQKRLVEDGA